MGTAGLSPAGWRPCRLLRGPHYSLRKTFYAVQHHRRFFPRASLAQGVQITGCQQIYSVFGNRRSGKDLLPEIVPRQNFQLVIDLDDRHDAAHGGSDNLVARDNG